MTIILMRRSLAEDGEFEAATRHHRVIHQRTMCYSGDLVVARYSALPYYQELEIDLANQDAKLINSYAQHRWVADFQYYDALRDYTFPTWDDANFYTCTHAGPFVVKGRTNSKKHQWNTHMFAADKRQAILVSSDLSNDAFIGEQGILYRQYVPLETFEIGINDIRFTNEWRFFFRLDKLLAAGYYWSQAEKADQYNASVPTEARELAEKIAAIAKDHINFFVVDVGRTEDGRWMMIELNDGQMSGLSMCNPEELYANL